MSSPAAATAAAPDGDWGWVVVAASFFIHVVMDGLTYAFGVLAAEFAESLGSSRQLNGWITSVLVSVLLGAGPVVSLACRRFGDRLVTIVGAVLASLGFALSYFVQQPQMFIVTISLLAGFGISLMYLPAIVCVGVYFDKRRSTAIGIAACGSGLGIFIFGLLINYLIVEYTWRGAMLILAGIVLNCAVFACLLRPLPVPKSSVNVLDIECNRFEPSSALNSKSSGFEFRSLPHLSTNRVIKINQRVASVDQLETVGRQRPLPLLVSRSAFVAASSLNLATTKPDPSFSSGSSPTSPLAVIRRRVQQLFPADLLGDPAFLLFLGSNLLFSVGFDAPFLYTPDRAMQAGYSATQSALLLSVIGVANMIGRLAFGLLSDRPGVNKPALYATALAVAGAALFFSFISEVYAFMAVYCAVFGVFVGAYVTLTPAVLAHLLGPERLSDSFGLTLLFQAIGVVSGPPMAGAIFDRTHSFNASYMVSGACMLLSGAILYPLPCVIRWQAAKQGKRVCADPITVVTEAPLLQSNASPTSDSDKNRIQ
ncbi:hypothetical protein BOX15_Mlig025363g2 [Macrostomum lignano]|uniref:Major facilitator superfamily (MFS) profile domain-containing protein n=1 Tax=Macrostomum lignano TaxID=282301 RepID=A0A267G4U5_9PLAT|nr:hypothetical protein BOX15_Mlig025363g2 [Macrostomum lignano]